MANVLAVNQRKTYRMVDKKKVKVPPPSAANLAHAATVTKANYWFKEANEERIKKNRFFRQADKKHI